MKQSTKKLISMLVALAFLIAAFVFYFDFVVPAYGDMQALKGRELGEQNFFSQESNTITQVQKLIATYKNESQEQTAVEMSLPPEQDVSGALAQIYGIAAVNNINLSNVSIAVSSVVTNSGAITSVPSLLLKPVGSVSFAVSVSGSYEDFKNFLSEIETNVRIFDVKNLSIQPSSQAGSLTKDIFNYNMTITAYYQAS